MNCSRIVCSTLLWMVFCHALAAEPAPGEYISEKGWGTLKVARRADGMLHFDIAAMGANGHSCGIEGAIRNGHAVLDDVSADEPCHVRFESDAAGVNVLLGEAGECRYYCGMRASFDGLYLVPAAGCRNSERKAAQGRFAKLYGAKDFQAALNALQPLLNTCKTTLYWLDEAQIRNDLAVTLYHLGRKEECLAVLKPTIDAYGADEDDLRRQARLPPTDFDSILPLVKAAGFNRKLCGAS